MQSKGLIRSNFHNHIDQRFDLKLLNFIFKYIIFKVYLINTQDSCQIKLILIENLCCVRENF